MTKNSLGGVLLKAMQKEVCEFFVNRKLGIIMNDFDTFSLLL